MTSKSQHELKVPALFKRFASKRAAQELEAEEGQAQRRRLRASFEDDEEQPPAQPRSCVDLQALLFACPTLIDALLEPDGLRTISLVARDAASLAAVLCARTADVAGLWHQLARRCDPAFTAAGTTTEALAAVRRACKADPARAEFMNKSTALKDYCLTEKNLADVPCTWFYHPWAEQPIAKYSKLAILAVARRKHGSAAGLAAARLAARGKILKMRAARGKAKAVRDQMSGQRRESVLAALEDAGLCELDCQRCQKDSSVQAFIKRGAGTAAGVAAALQEQHEEAELKEQRKWQLQLRLVKAGLGAKTHWAAAQAYIAAGEQRLQAVVTAVREEHSAAAVKAQRRKRMYQLLAKEKLPDTVYIAATRYKVPGLDAYCDSGEGSEAVVLSAARALRDARQAWVQRWQRMQRRLADEGLSRHVHDAPVQAYIGSGEGSEEAILQPLLMEQLMERALLYRSQEMQELLAAEGLQQYIHERAVQQYVRNGTGSAQSAVEAARKKAEDRRLFEQRRVRLTELLAAEGISIEEVVLQSRVLQQYMYHGEGTEAAAMESGRQVERARRERCQRHSVMTQLLAAQGMDLLVWEDEVEGMGAYLRHGLGSPEELAAQARAHRDARGPALAAYAV